MLAQIWPQLYLCVCLCMCVCVSKKGKGGLRRTCLCKWVGGHSRRPGMMGQMADEPRLTQSHPTSTQPHPHHNRHHHHQQQPPHDESICNRDIITRGCQPSHATYSNWEMTKCQFEWILGMKVCRRVSNHVSLCAGCSPDIMPLGQSLTTDWCAHQNI